MSDTTSVYWCVITATSSWDRQIVRILDLWAAAMEAVGIMVQSRSILKDENRGRKGIEHMTADKYLMWYIILFWTQGCVSLQFLYT